MGGGVGISIMGSHRIASEHMTFAMPETAIGFYPDVGSSYFMSRLGTIGTMLALTGQPLDHTASLALGITNYFVPREAGRGLVVRVAKVGVDATLAALTETSPTCSTLPILQALADRCFGASTVEEIFDLLEETAASGDLATQAQEAVNALKRRSPTSLKVTREQLTRGSNMTFTDCLRMEYRMSHAFMHGHDFYEGVRAVLIDKDHSPRWLPPSLDQVDDALVASHFKELGDRELRLSTN
jgi:enoyl-CoA hydratase